MLYIYHLVARGVDGAASFQVRRVSGNQEEEHAMKRFIFSFVGLLGLLLMAGTPAMPAAAADPQGPPYNEFTDVHETDWFYGPVIDLAQAGVISGYADGTFRPNAYTTRAQFAKIVVLGEKIPVDTTGGPHFSDVPVAHPFYAVIETLHNKGLLDGYADGTFRPGAYVTRGQIAKITIHASGWEHDTSGGAHFTDVPMGSPWYEDVETAWHNGIISGYDDATFRVNGNATRAQIAKVLYLALHVSK